MAMVEARVFAGEDQNEHMAAIDGGRDRNCRTCYASLEVPRRVKHFESMKNVEENIIQLCTFFLYSECDH